MVGLWSLSQRTLLSSKQHIFSIPCPPFLFTYFFIHLSWGCPILTLDNLYLMMWYTGSSHLYTNYIHVVFLICSFILLKKTAPSHHPTPLNPKSSPEIAPESSPISRSHGKGQHLSNQARPSMTHHGRRARKHQKARASFPIGSMNKIIYLHLVDF